ncbi:hypothetical protein CP02DC14_1570, partial [Chlamydia psittaci 02DC14]
SKLGSFFFSAISITKDKLGKIHKEGIPNISLNFLCLFI